MTMTVAPGEGGQICDTRERAVWMPSVRRTPLDAFRPAARLTAPTQRGAEHVPNPFGGKKIQNLAVSLHVTQPSLSFELTPCLRPLHRPFAFLSQPGKVSEVIEKMLAHEKTFRLVRPRRPPRAQIYTIASPPTFNPFPLPV
jgi:hypothetical protein